MKKRSRGKKKKKKDGSVTAAAKKILRRSSTSKKKKAGAASSSGKKNAKSKSSAVGKRIAQNAKSLNRSATKKGGKKKKKKKKNKKRKNDGGGFFLGGDDDDDDNPFLNKDQPLTAEELEMRKAADEQREMTERFQMAAEDLLTVNRTLGADGGEVNTPHERLALGCQVRAKYGGKDKVMQAGSLSTNISQLWSHALPLCRVRAGRSRVKNHKPQVAN